MTEKRFYYNTFYYPNTDEIMEYEIIDRESFPNYPNHNESTDLCGWYIYIPENDSNWQDMCIDKLNELNDENKELKHHIKELEREVHFEHMRSMFSTVKSFKGDVSKRYYYSEETDTLYDTANNYGQYDKILDKKEIAMLLNEYETLLNNEGLND